jgi:hypothetical protein
MRYQYVVAYQMLGGLTIRKGEREKVLYQEEGIRASLAPFESARLKELNQAYAVANSVLNRFLGGGPAGRFDEVVQAEQKKIEEVQRSQLKDAAILLIEMKGQVDVTLVSPTFECEEFAVYWEALNGQPLLNKHKADIEAVVTGLLVGGPQGMGLQQKGDRLWLREESGRYVYSIRLTMQGEGAVSSHLTEEIEREVRHYVDKARHSGALAKVQTLLVALIAPEGDRLRAFISGWAALEIFTNQLYAAYQKTGVIRGPRRNLLGKTRAWIRRFLRLNSPDTLSLRFQAVANVVKHGVDVDSDLRQFQSLKKIRDRFYHGTLLENRSLPNHELAKLLRNYLRAYLDTR